MKQLTQENFLKPDPVSQCFVIINKNNQGNSMTENHWVKLFLNPQLITTVPPEVKRLFEVARSTFLYGYCCYPIYTLALEQVFRVVEAAITYKYKLLNSRKENITFEKKIDRLIEEKIILAQDKIKWDNIRKFRNLVSHPSQQNILPPGVTWDIFNKLVSQINELFISV